MIDIHSHILNNIDDGSRSINESVEILRNMKECGFTDIILTPHYILDTKYQNTIKEKQEKLEILKKELNKENIDINLYLGNEIYIDTDIKKKIKKEALSLNNSRYILLEFPMNGEYNNSYGIISGLIEKGYKVVLAHPERYENVKKDISILDEYKELGVIFQSNIGSIFGMYGKKEKKALKKLLKMHYIDILSSDIHHKSYDYKFFKDIYKKLGKIIDKEYIDDLIVNNASKIIKNEEI